MRSVLRTRPSTDTHTKTKDIADPHVIGTQRASASRHERTVAARRIGRAMFVTGVSDWAAG